MIAPARAAAIVLVLLSSGATQGLCFMPGTGDASPRDAHGCCRKGWTQGTPECCMTGAADEEPARVAAGTPLAEPGPAGALTGMADTPRTGRAVTPADRSHPPPGSLPLRI